MASIAQMVVTIRRYGVVDRRVLRAVREVDRKAFVPARWRPLAYEDRALPIGFGQTISQPYTVACMCELLVHGSSFIAEDAKVLEIGTGSGWQTAILSRIFSQVYSVEVVAELSRMAERNLHELRISNFELRVGDGKLGWPEYAPYPAIIVAADAKEIPPVLIDQLAEGGRMVIPVRGEMLVVEKHGNFVFVPLV